MIRLVFLEFDRSQSFAQFFSGAEIDFHFFDHGCREGLFVLSTFAGKRKGKRAEITLSVRFHLRRRK